MFKKILVPLDGSPPSEAALPVAAELARRCGASIELATISLVPSLYHAIDERVLSHDLKTCLHYLEQRAEELRETGLVAGVYAGEGAPAVARSLVAHAKACGADLIVITSHGQGAPERMLERALLGSTAERVAHLAPMPVLLVRPPVAPVAKAASPRKRVATGR